MIHTGDCLEVMATLDAESIDAIVTDPPYGLEFMGKSWDKLGGDGWRAGGFGQPGIGARPTAWTSHGDTANATCASCGSRMRGARKCECAEPDWRVKGAPAGKRNAGAEQQAFHAAWAREALRVAKPGAYLLAFGGTRTVHRMTCAIEDTGWEIRDTLVWAYASGFPKSANPGRTNDVAQCRLRGEHSDDAEHLCAMVSPVEWYDLGTALKPAWEPIVMARKPLRGTVAANVRAHGTGALNIGGCRIGFASDADRDASVPGTTPPSTGERGSMAGALPRVPFSRAGEPSADRRYTTNGGTDFAALPGPRGGDPSGRWPANIVLTDPIFDGGWDGVVGGGEVASGVAVRRNGVKGNSEWVFGGGIGEYAPGTPDMGYGDAGTYSRFFIIPKARRKERGEGNTHPTVKPVALMRHLVRLVTQPGGTVLDPFLGSGTTALAAEEEGFEWIGIEREAEYVAMAETRLMAAFLGSLQDRTEAP